MRVKVCGMSDPLNVKEIAEAKPDFMGFIFYPESIRYVGEEPEMALFHNVAAGIGRIGVFLNEENNKILDLSNHASLEMVQLHGSESPESCLQLKSSGLKIIKAFHIGEDFSFDYLKHYESACEYFLFDTKSELYGGSGRKFDWKKLGEYSLDKPFFLSGGISPDDAGSIKSIENRGLFGVDINSRFETSPGIKDAGRIKTFIEELKSDQK